MLFFLVLLLGVCGFAMVVVGEFPWPGGRKIDARSARWAGGVFLAVVPLIFATRLVANQFEGGPDLDLWPAHLIVGLLCGIVGTVMLFKAAARSVPTRRAATSNPFSSAPIPQVELDILQPGEDDATEVLTEEPPDEPASAASKAPTKGTRARTGTTKGMAKEGPTGASGKPARGSGQSSKSRPSRPSTPAPAPPPENNPFDFS